MASTSQLLTVLAVLLFTVTVEAQNKYADMAKACYVKDRTESDSATCLVKVWNDIRPFLIKGDPEANIQSFDPMRIDDFQMDEQGTVVQAKVSFLNTTAIGAGNYNIKSASYNRANKTVTTVLDIPSLYLDGQYTVEGTILLLPLNGKGHYSLNLTNVQSKFVSHLRRQGTLMTVVKLDVTNTLDNIKFALDGLLGDDTVAAAIKNMLNDNSKQIYEDFRPQIENIISKALKNSFEAIGAGLPD